MSIHLIDCALKTTLPATHKLVLIAFANSADDLTRIAYPGQENVMAYASTSRTRSYLVIKELVERGFLKLHRQGRRGRRAEYVVFPNGCCEGHGKHCVHNETEWVPPTGPSEREESRPRDPDPSEQLGSRPRDPASVNGSHLRDPNGVEDLGSHPRDPLSVKGPNRVPPTGPLTYLTTNPPTPQRAGGICKRHPDTPGENCRACGTTSRQIERAAAKTKAAAKRNATVDFIHTQRADRAAADPAVAQAAINQIRSHLQLINTQTGPGA
jgi:hypothetical protein